MVAVIVKMCLVKYHVLILCLILLDCNALNCRSDGAPKESELKNIYKKCLKMQEGKSSNSNRSSDQDSREPREHQKQEWNSERDNEEKSGRNDKPNGRDRMSVRSGMSDDRGDTGRDNDRNDNMERMGNRKRMGNERNDKMNNNGRYGRDDYYNNGGDFPRRDEFGEDIPRYSQNNYYTSSQPPRRYKREKRPENSGQRSQYNPNSRKISGYEDYRSDEKNSSENSSKETDNKACAMHCFLENLEMTGEDGMPDRYLVTHTVTKDVKNEDLRDFLEESIEECFQILENENTEDKCDYSKNLLMCLSEKGRANCDDWKDDLKL